MRDQTKHELIAMVRSRWYWTAGALGLMAASIVTSLFIPVAMHRVWLPVVAFLNPGVDAPDNWALALTYAAKSAMVVMLLCSVFTGMGLWRMTVQMKKQGRFQSIHRTS